MMSRKVLTENRRVWNKKLQCHLRSAPDVLIPPTPAHAPREEPVIGADPDPNQNKL